MGKLITYFVVLNFLAIFTLSGGKSLPNNPCPEFFKYEISANKNVTGLVTVPFDGLPIYLEIEASMGGTYRKKRNMSINLLSNADELLLGTDKFIQYRLNFPVQKSIPQITLIKLNGADLCSGPKLALSDKICTLTKLKFAHKYPSNSSKRQKRQQQQQQDEYQAGLLEVLPEGNEYFYPLICANYDVDPMGEEEEDEINFEDEEDEESSSSESDDDDEAQINFRETKKPVKFTHSTSFRPKTTTRKKNVDRHDVPRILGKIKTKVKTDKVGIK